MPREQDLMLAMASALVAVAYRACRAANCGVHDAISGTRRAGGRIGGASVKPTPTEFDCEGCGVHVFNIGRARPTSGFCAVCEFLSKHTPPEELMDMRRRCEPGGWISEREQRQKASYAR
jgi:hypothetical protein